jgi:hypothetical protein
VPPLDQRNSLLRQPGGRGDIRLTQSPSTPKRTKEPSDPKIVHVVDRELDRTLPPYRAGYARSCLAA